MKVKSLFSSRQSLPLLIGAVTLAIVALLLLRGGTHVVDEMNRQNGARPDERELVTIQVGTKYKLKRASWGPVTPPEKEPPEETEPEPAPQPFEGLDVGVQGR